MSKITKEERNIHAEHRKRVKRKYVTSGLEQFADHEVLEMLLYFSIPQMDTNPIAHRLMKHFHNLSSVFDASIDELTEVPGVGEHSAILINLIPALMRRYTKDKSKAISIIENQQMAKEYLTKLYDCSEIEQFFIICLRPDNSIIDSTCLSVGTCSKVEIQIRELTRYVFKNKCERIIIAHNHPHSIAEPSEEDILMTHKLVSSCVLNDIEILDHLIIAPDGVFSFSKAGLLKSISEELIKRMAIDPSSLRYRRLMCQESPYKPI